MPAIRNKDKNVWETTRFVSVAFNLCQSFEKTATTQKTGYNFKYPNAINLHTAFNLLLKLIDFENSMNMVVLL